MKSSRGIWLLIAMVVTLTTMAATLSIGAAPFEPQVGLAGPADPAGALDDGGPIQGLAFQGVNNPNNPELWQLGTGQCPRISF